MRTMKTLAFTGTCALLLAACGGQPDSAQSDGGEGGDAALSADAGPAVPQAVAEARACSQASTDVVAAFTAPVIEAAAAADLNAAIADAFIAHASAQPCVFALDSGLRIRVDTPAADAAPSPVSGEVVRVHYEGKLPNGTVFDSSYERGEPAEFPSNRLIRGWVEALPLMRVGETWTLMIPSDLAYGPAGTPGGPIGPNEALIFKIELLGLPDRPAEASDGQ